MSTSLVTLQHDVFPDVLYRHAHDILCHNRAAPLSTLYAVLILPSPDSTVKCSSRLAHPIHGTTHPTNR